MGLLKLIIAALVIGAIAVIINEVRKRSKEEKTVADLQDELDIVNIDLARAELEDGVLTARTDLKAKRAELSKKIVELETPTETKKKKKGSK